MAACARNLKPLLRIFLIAAIAAGASACSMLPDWMGGSPDEPSPPPVITGSQTSSAQPAPEGQTVAEASDKYPVLAETPDKAPPSTSTDEQKQVADALIADRTDAQYSADALRGGTVTAAAPPPPGPPPSAQPAAPAEDESEPPPPPPPSNEPKFNPHAPPIYRAAQPAPAEAPPTPAAQPPAETESQASVDLASAEPAPATPASTGPASAAAAPPATAVSPAPEAVVSFSPNSTALDAAERAKVVAAAKAWRANGARGFVRVVGHSAPPASNAATAKAMISGFDRSQARATAVANELIKSGVPANKVLIEAKGEAAGAAGTTAEIFLQS